MNTKTTPPTPSSAVRDVIFSQHEVLRGLLAKTVEMANVEMKSALELESLRASARRLYEALADHMRFEEEVLPTALREVIGWGPALQQRMEEDHERQRASLAVAFSGLGPDGPALIQSVRSFSLTLLADMETEEQGLLEADFDAMTIDAKGG